MSPLHLTPGVTREALTKCFRFVLLKALFILVAIPLQSAAQRGCKNIETGSMTFAVIQLLARYSVKKRYVCLRLFESGKICFIFYFLL